MSSPAEGAEPQGELEPLESGSSYPRQSIHAHSYPRERHGNLFGTSLRAGPSGRKEGEGLEASVESKDSDEKESCS